MAAASERGGSRTSLPARWLIGLGIAFVILGGLVSAATGPLALPRGSWLTAYLVLVCGVAQCAIGWATTHRPGPDRADLVLLVGWNAGNAAVVAGTLAAVPYLVDLGGAILLVPLIVLLRAVLRRPDDRAIRLAPLWRGLLVALIVVLIASIPIGLVLTHVRAG